MSEDKTLNDSIDGWFRGIIFILCDFGASLITVLVRPLRGPLYLLKHLYARSRQQIRPHVFLFLSASLVFLAPPFIKTAITAWHEAKERPTNSLAYTYTVNGKDLLSPDPVREVMHKAAELIESKPIIPALLGAFALATILDILLRITASRLFLGRIRRSTASNLFFFVAGAQIFLFAVLWALQDHFRFSLDDFAEWICGLDR